MSEAINPVLRLYKDSYNTEGYSSVNHMSRAMQYESEILSPVVTHLFYTSAEYGSKNFPLLFLTEGMNNVRSVKSIEYRQPVMGRPKKTSTVAVSIYNAADKPGRNGAIFEIPFSDRLFHKSLQLISKNKGVQVRVVNDPREENGVYYYPVRLTTHDKSAYCPVEYLQAGARWGRIISKVGIEDSDGVEHRSFAPGLMTNQVSLVRDSYKIRGNTEEKVMVVEIPTDEGPKKFWCEWELYLRGLEWKEKCESDLWYSLYNKTEDGQILDVDEDSGEVVPQGAGILQQITNEDTYSFMTEDKLTQIIRDAFYNASDATSKRIEVFTGTGGKEEIDNALKDKAKGFSFIDNSDKFIKGEGNELAFGAYFNTFRHVDGHVVTFRTLPLLDNGVVAETDDLHPISGLPLESYSMYFVDMSTYEGEMNVKYIQEQGREEKSFVVPGAKVPKGFGETPYRATSRDRSSIEWMKSQGAHIKRPTNCFKVFNTLS